jgi:2-C-methyl-D-erythritol 2,4-cyclodiphosphate synthase
MNEYRIGHGFDVHALVTGRPLILGGVLIEHSRGLDGHSDADVVTHAVMDALLGAARLPDIGVHFPPDDERFRDANSIDLLKQVRALVLEAEVSKIVNVDVTIVAQSPKLAMHLTAMRRNLAAALEVTGDRVNVKATTTEKLGCIGREEGIAAEAVCLIVHE